MKKDRTQIWREQMREHSRRLLDLMTQGDEKEIKRVLVMLKGRDLSVSLALFIHYLNGMISNPLD